jgi:hypothetical protein
MSSPRLGALARAVLICLTSATLAWSDGPGVLLSSKSPKDFPLSANSSAKEWKHVSGVIADSSPFGKPLPEARTEIRSRWTEQNLYLLFISKYQKLYLKPNPVLTSDTWGLWNYDVDEAFIGSDFHNVDVYKEFEVSPQGEYIDLDVDRSRKGEQADADWDSGWHVRARIDQKRRLWFCEMQIPWRAVATHAPAVNDEFRLNLYHIEGGPVERKYVVWQITNSPSFHTPQSFGRLRLVR